MAIELFSEVDNRFLRGRAFSGEEESNVSAEIPELKESEALCGK